MDSPESLGHTTIFNGNVLLFYSFDVGDEIDLQEIKHKNLLPVKVVPLSPYFKNYHIPLSFTLSEDERFLTEAQESGVRVDGTLCISSKLHHFGVLSFCYKVPFNNSLEELKLKVLKIKNLFDKKSEQDAKRIFDKILPTVKKSRFYSLKNFYFAVQVEPLKGVSAQQFKNLYGAKIASLLRLEVETLSDYQREEILASATGYSGNDLVIIDSEASFIYDKEYFESLEFFELATVQQLELLYFDKLLDEKLNYFYAEKSYKIPLKAYIPILSEKLNLSVSLLARLRVDISVITERLGNSIKMVGDTYYIKLYSMIREQLSLDEWQESINRKLDIIKDLYTVSQDRLDIIHEEILTVVIIILITFEAILAFLK